MTKKRVGKTRAFLCHASEDKETVRALYRRLESDGVTPWLDEEELLPGEKWQERIEKAVRGADTVIICLSKASVNKKGYVQREMKYALEMALEHPGEDIYLIPIKLNECEFPESLRQWHYVDIRDEKGYERLLKALRSIASIDLEPEHIAEGRSIPRFLVHNHYARFTSETTENQCDSLLISDRTQFSNNIGSMLRQIGIKIREYAPPFLHPVIFSHMYDLSAMKLVVLVRGENFSNVGNDELFSQLSEFVLGGGHLLATSWVAWENFFSGQLSEVLPFTSMNGDFHEDQRVTCVPSDLEITRHLFPEQLSFNTSFELLQERSGSVVFLRTNELLPIPIFGYRKSGKGFCYYLNSCQHCCGGDMRSPLEANAV